MKNKIAWQNRWAFILLIAGSLLFAPATGDAVTITAASCSQADVQAAVNTANDDDTIQVPAGNCTWESEKNRGRFCETPLHGRQS